ncbi:MAG: hypothetical protein IPK12_23675 [Gemmatimonadetes bacterium]|nr:hypothetical protein [Gemmatimonadota bacterium]
MTAPHDALNATSDPVAEIRAALEDIARRFGSVVALDDADGRLMLAKQLAYRGVWVGPAPVVAEAPEEPAVLEVVAGLQAQVDAIWRELARLTPAQATPENPRPEVG